MKMYRIGLLAFTLTSVAALAAANAADMYVAPPAGPGGYKDAPWVPNWAGFYLGVHAGYASSDIKHDANHIVPDDNGGMGGGQIGYNFQRGAFVFGVEADGTALGLDKTTPCFNPSFKCHAQQDWMSTVRGRLGYSFGQVLVYGTGGVAFSELDGETINAGGVHFRDDKSLTGYVVGGGAEYQFTPKWIGRVEYLFADFGHENFTFDVAYPHIGDQVQQVRAGLSYRLVPGYEPLK